MWKGKERKGLAALLGIPMLLCNVTQQIQKKSAIKEKNPTKEFCIVMKVQNAFYVKKNCSNSVLLLLFSFTDRISPGLPLYTAGPL